MYLILIAIVVAGIMSFVLFKYFDEGYSTRHAIAGIFGLLLGLLSAIAAIAYAFIVWHYIAAEYKSEIINREYGTNYTQEEVFYASDVIDTIRNLNRKRYEFNGNLMRGDHEK